MPPVVIDVTAARAAGDQRDVVHRAVQACAEGRLVAFPTETVYGLAASALDGAAVARLLDVKGRDPNRPLALAVKSADEALDYVPNMPSMGRRLARRCWPGPLTLVFDNRHPDSLAEQFPAEVRQAVLGKGTVGVRCPAHWLILDVLRMLAGPLVLTSANKSGGPESLAGSEVVAQLDGAIDLVLDDGQCQFGQASTVVYVKPGELKVLREGVIGAATLRRLASFVVLFVCTGNTCRSPMAEALCRKHLAKRLGCQIEELEDRSVVVESAGIAAMSGGRASYESVQIMAEHGLEIGGHASQPVSDRLVRHADVIFTMTASHRAALLAQWPDAASRVHILSPRGTDVADPVGGPEELYRRCAEQLDGLIADRVAAFDLDDFSASSAPAVAS